MKLRANPLVHELFTWVWLHDLGTRFGRTVTLGDVPDEVWDDVAGAGVDAVWLMGVWCRSPAGAAIARSEASMASAQRAALPDVTDDDVVGSAYCIRDYTVDPRLGGDEGLAAARAALAARGVGLILDFVPNHVAPDHPWTHEHPGFFVTGTADDLARDPASFLAVGDAVVARGRDPYFPAWPEVVQLDTSRPETRAAAADVLRSIAARADGARCDMAMLMLDDVFARTWAERAAGGPTPDGGRGYWPTVIAAVRAEYPDFAFWAEAYWDLEPVLVEQGFDACYDKRLYDRLVHREGAATVRAHLAADVAYQAHTVRFAENHDEPRLAGVLVSGPARVAAVTSLTLPGVALLHEGQADGRTVRVPVTLGRRPVEPADADLRAWYGRLLGALGRGVRRGSWTLLDVDGWPDNRTCEHLVAWRWDGPAPLLVVVNLSPATADGIVRVGSGLPAPVVLEDVLTGERYERDGAVIAADGLYVRLPADGIHAFAW